MQVCAAGPGGQVGGQVLTNARSTPILVRRVRGTPADAHCCPRNEPRPCLSALPPPFPAPSPTAASYAAAAAAAASAAARVAATPAAAAAAAAPIAAVQARGLGCRGSTARWRARRQRAARVRVVWCGGARNASASERSGVARGRSPPFSKFWLVGAGQLKICNACCPAGPAPVATAADQHQVNDGLVHTRNRFSTSFLDLQVCQHGPTGVVHSHATAVAVPLPRCFATDEDARGDVESRPQAEHASRHR